jgi:hypothetical protein
MAKQPRKNSGKRVGPQETELVDRLLSGIAEEKYQGKQVVVIGGQIFILPEDDWKATALVDDLEKKYPNQIPHLVFVPRSETYIL